MSARTRLHAIASVLTVGRTVTHPQHRPLFKLDAACCLLALALAPPAGLSHHGDLAAVCGLGGILVLDLDLCPRKAACSDDVDMTPCSTDANVAFFLAQQDAQPGGAPFGENAREERAALGARASAHGCDALKPALLARACLMSDHHKRSDQRDGKSESEVAQRVTCAVWIPGKWYVPVGRRMRSC